MPKPILRSPFAPHFSAINADELASALKVVADPSRLRILALLHEHGTLNACDIIPVLGLAQPTVARCMQILEEAELVSGTERGVYVDRRLEVGRLITLSDLLHPGGAR